MKNRIDNLKQLIVRLLNEENRQPEIKIPDSLEDLQKLLRALMNVRFPRHLSDDVLNMQDEELKMQLKDKGVVKLDDISVSSSDTRLLLWHGDITRLQVNAIVNAANSRMLGCFVPLIYGAGQSSQAYAN